VVLKQLHPNTKPGAGLEGCPYLKNANKKTAGIMHHPDRFFISGCLSTFFVLTS
jgi:hypothetical protein